MAISIPNLKAAGIQRLAMCGLVRKTNKTLRDLAAKHEKSTPYYYKLKRNNNLVYAFVDLDNWKHSIHLHIDLATDTYFTTSPPRLSQGAPKLDHILEPFLERKIHVEVTAFHSIPLRNSPSIMKALGNITVEADGIKLKLTGVTFTAEGMQLDKVYLNESQDEVALRTTGHFDFEILTSYCDDCLEAISRYSSLFLDEENTIGRPESN